MSSQQENQQIDEIAQKKQQIMEEKRTENRDVEVKDALQKSRESKLSEQQQQNGQDNENPEEEKQDQEIAFQEIESNLRKLVEELGIDFDKIKEAITKNRFIEECKLDKEWQDKLLVEVEQKSIQGYFKVILERANPLMTEMFAEMAKQGTDVEMPTSLEEFNQIAWQNLTAPIGEDDDQEGEEEEEDEAE